MLSDSKTAVGSVTFDLESPSIALDNGLQLNYNGQVGSTGTLTYINDAGVETDINNLSLNLTIPQENMFNQYYVKLIYDFSAVNVGTITFGANDYTLTSGQMSAMTTTGTTNEFYSISGTTNSPQALAKGISLNIFEFLKQFKYAHTEAVDTIFNFNIAIIVDTASSCQSTNRSQTIINGKINLVNIVNLAPTIVFNENALTFTVSGGGYGTGYRQNASLNITDGSPVYLSFEFKSFLNSGTIEDTTNWSYEVIDDKITIKSKYLLSNQVSLDEIGQQLLDQINTMNFNTSDADILYSGRWETTYEIKSAVVVKYSFNNSDWILWQVQNLNWSFQLVIDTPE